MNLELFFYFLYKICKIDTSSTCATDSWWEEQFALLMAGVRDSRMHDTTLNFTTWYSCEYLPSVEKKIRDIMRDTSLEDLIDKMEADIKFAINSGKDLPPDWIKKKSDFLKVLYALSNFAQQYESVTEVGCP